MRALVTGGAGFVGHHFVEHFLKNTDWEIVVFDKLNYAALGFDRLRDIEAFDDKRVTILTSDFCYPLTVGIRQEIGKVDYIFHLGAESHVDNSISNPEPFVMSNVLGTLHMLDLALKLPNLKCFFYFSTDEVFGPAPLGTDYQENDRHNPTNPYSATKSGGEMLVKCYRNSYGLPAIITRSMNIFGERQYPEKFIPKAINCVLSGTNLPIHSNSEKTKAGSRFYIHARNVADAYLFLINKLENGVNLIGEDFHITGEREVDNLQMAQFIARIIGKPLHHELVDFHSSRPGHDLRYSLDGSKIFKLGWKMPKTFEDSLAKTIQWSLDHDRWLSIDPPEILDGSGEDGLSSNNFRLRYKSNSLHGFEPASN